jgi:hypothetical protein
MDDNHYTVNTEINVDAPIVGEPSTLMYSEYERLKTFPWQWSHPTSKATVAANGFYASEPQRDLRCAFCNLKVEASMIATFLVKNISDEHKSRSETCNFAHDRGSSNNVALGENNNYRYEKDRIISFLRSDVNVPVDPYDLAKFGFYWTGSMDWSRCAFCRLEVRGWEVDDRAESEHLRWNPRCPFIQHRAVGNVRIGEENTEDINEATSRRMIAPSVSSYATNGNVGNTRAAGLVQRAHYPEYASVNLRMNTYHMWPISMGQTPYELAEAGFYYIGSSDRVRCFMCGGGLKDWHHCDIPWNEHAKWFPYCSHLKAKMRPEFIARMQSMRIAETTIPIENEMPHHEITNAEMESFTAPVPQLSNETLNIGPATSTSTSHEGLLLEHNVIENNVITTQETLNGMKLDQTKEFDKESNELGMCKICYDKELGILFQPCGHMSCTMCSTQFEICPVCRKKMDKQLVIKLDRTMKIDKEINELGMCTICYHEELGILFQPCGHMSCTMCSKNFDTCPVCNKKIDEQIRAFL